MTSWVALVVLLMVAAFVLLAVEILLLPGFGVVGGLGALSVLGATIVAWTKLGVTWGLIALGAGVGASALLLWIFPRTSAGRAMVLVEAHRARGVDPSLARLVGRTGCALTPLRPSGTADIDGRTVDVLTDGVYVDAGVPLRVVRVEGARVVVEPVA